MTFQFDAAGPPARLERIDPEPSAGHRLRLITLIRQKDTDAATELVQRLEARATPRKLPITTCTRCSPRWTGWRIGAPRCGNG